MRRLAWPALAALLIAGRLDAATINWTGGADNNWYTAGNWSPAQVPGSADNVTIDANATVTVSASSPAIAFNSLTLGDSAGTNSATLKVSTAIITSGSLQIDKNASLVDDTTVQFLLGSVTVASGGKVTHSANAGALQHSVNLQVTGNLNVQSGGLIDANALGYAGGASATAGSGSGAGAGSSSNGGGGAGHGGNGGTGQGGTAAGGSYDTISGPTDLGSGGGGSNGVGGGAGGGLINLNVTGTLTVGGTIRADGAAGSSAGGYGGGGGAGGSINLTQGTLAGSGILSANGGAGAAGSTANGGGGAGGRIAGAGTSFQGTVSFLGGAAGGTGASNGGNGTSYSSVNTPLPTTPAFANVFGSSLTVNWNPNGQTEFYVQVSPKQDFSANLTSSDTLNTSATFMNLLPNTTYYARAATIISGSVATAYVSLGSTRTVVTPGETWVGPSGAYWQDTVNWSNGAVPVSTDPVTIDQNVTVLTYTTAPVTFGNLYLGDSGGLFAPSFTLSTGAASTGGIVVYRNATLTQASTQTVTIASMTMYSGSLVNHSANTGTRQYIIKLNIANVFDMQAGSSMTLNGVGYSAGNGPGGGPTGGGGYGGGAAHGGVGAPNAPAASGSVNVYDSLSNPIDLGSGGGSAGGGGGGAAIVNVAGTFNLNGQINANGVSAGYGVGGGAGGTVNITAVTLTGTGSVNALGAQGGGGGTGGGNGGGGRIAVIVSGSDASNLTLSAAGYGSAGTVYRQTLGATSVAISNGNLGAASYSTPVSLAIVGAQTLSISTLSVSNAQPAFDGSIALFVQSSASFSGTNTLTASSATLPASTTLTSNTTLAVSTLTVSGDLIMQANSVLQQTSTIPLAINGNLTMQSGSKVTGMANGSSLLYAVNLNVGGSANIQSGGLIDANGLGYAGGGSGAAGNGSGGGGGSGSLGGGGAGYGGNGGTGQGGTSGGVAYGNISNPNSLGSGGGGGNGVVGGAGGGLITLSVTGTLTVSGTVRANGAAGAGGGAYGGGGGSGGGIIIAAASLAGSGLISSNGGNGGTGTTDSGGGGSGGRIAGAASFPGTVSISSGNAGGTGAAAGQQGTSYNSVAAAPSSMVPAFTNVGVSSFTVQWNGNGETLFFAEISKTSNFSDSLISSQTANSFATFTNLSGNTTYYVQVAAVRGGWVATAYTNLGSTRTVVTPGETWVGPSGGDWNSPANWSNGAVPISTDPVTIDQNVTVIAYATGPAITFGNLYLGDSGGLFAPTFTLSTGAASSGGIVLYKNSVLTQASTQTVAIASMTMYSGSLMNTSANTATRQYIVNLNIANVFDMQAGSSMTLNGLGYSAGNGPGGGAACFSGYGGGGGHGGVGAPNAPCVPSSANVYDSLSNPIDLGSGGGNGGGGGGAAIINVGGTFNLNGKISANGASVGYGVGGGAGGTINITAVTLTGTGTANATGAPGGGGGGGGGDGGGGRIAIAVSGSDTSNLTLSAAGYGSAGTTYRNILGSKMLVISNAGLSAAGYATSLSSTIAQAQTLSISSFSLTNAQATFDGTVALLVQSSASFSGTNTLTASSATLPGGTYLASNTTLVISTLTVAGDLTMQANSILQQTSTIPLAINGNLTMQSGSTITSVANGASLVYAVNLNVGGNMSVLAGSSINVTGLGFAGGASGASGSGTGAGFGSSSLGGGGAGYGGNGGTGQGGTAAGASYGTISNPNSLGSGGGGGNGVAGGAGGGLITLNVTGTLTVGGTIRADGVAGAGGNAYGGGGGSGGGINVAVGAFAGSGLISAVGGNGGAGTTSSGGGGGGGRIVGAASFAGMVNVSIGTAGGVGAVAGQPGTSYNAAIGAPSTVGVSTFTSVSPTSLTLNWNANGNLGGTRYFAQISKNSNFNPILISSVTANTNAAFANLTGNVTYYAEVAAMSNGSIATTFTSLGSTQTPPSLGETWVGPTGAYWQDAINWSNGAVPISTDPVTIDQNVTVLTYTTAPVTFGNLYLGDSGGLFAPTFTLSTGAASTGGIVLYKNSTLTQASTQTVSIASMTMYSGSLLNHSANAATRQCIVKLSITNLFDMQTGSSMTLNGMGYSAGNGPGGGAACFSGYGGGGGHGGVGAPNAPCVPSSANVYDSLSNPIDLGSGGGNGGGGGGAAIINVAGTFNLNGQINANGVSAGYGVGGGAGGTVNITAVTLTGTGSVNAIGAQGGGGGTGGGNGGGGRVAVIVSGSDTSSLTLSAAGYGSAGTVYRQTLGATSVAISNGNLGAASYSTPVSSAIVGAQTLSISTLSVSNAQPTFDGTLALLVQSSASFSGTNTLTASSATLPGGTYLASNTTLAISTLTVSGDLTMQASSVLQQTSTIPLAINGNLTMQSGSTITSVANGASLVYAVNLNVGGNMSVLAGSSINVTGLGFAGGASGASGSGTGAGFGSSSLGGGGAGYGGNGGTGQGGTAAGASYGTISNPNSLGSGGGGGNGVAGGAGGGLITLNVTGTLTVGGTIRADGSGGAGGGAYGGGGGAGGAINVAAGAFAGSGLISANGGNGGAGSTSSGGGGGGGRVYARGIGAQSFNGTVTVVAGAAGGTGAAAGTLGTSYQPGLITPAGGTVASVVVPTLKAVVPPNSYAFNVLMNVQSKQEMEAPDLALSSAAIANFPNEFISSTTAKFKTVVATNTLVSPGLARKLITISIPVSTDTAGNVILDRALSPRSLRPRNLLVPLSVLRVFELNQVTNLFEMVLDGTNLPNLSSGTVDAQVYDPNGIFIVGLSSAAAPAPAALSTGTFTSVSTTSLTVNWSAGGNPSGTQYWAQLSQFPSFSPVLATSITANTSATFTGLNSNVAYYAEVAVSSNGSIASAFTNLGSTQTQATAFSPVAPVSLGTGTFTSVFVTSMTLNWGAADNPPGTLYWAQISQVASFNPVVASTITANVSATFTGLGGNTAYFAQVAVSSNGSIASLFANLGSTQTQPPPASTATITMPVTPTSSGTVTTTLGSGAIVQVTVPFGAFASATNLQVSIPVTSAIPSVPSNRGWAASKAAIVVNTSDGQQPVAPIPIAIGYQASDVGGLDPNALRMVRYDAATGWTMLDSSVDTAVQQVSGTTNHFSTFVLVAVSAGDLSTGYVYPNPFRPSQGHTKIKFANFPPAAHIKVYMPSGLLLNEFDTDAVGQLLTWDGTDKSGRNLPSGVYLALVQSGGHSTIVKFAVQR